MLGQMGRGRDELGDSLSLLRAEAGSGGGRAFDLDDAKALQTGADLSTPLASLLAGLAGHHPYSALHSQRVAFLAGELAKALGWTDADVQLAVRAALAHDVGKVAVSADLLGSPRHDLSRAETVAIQAHTIRGEALLEQAGLHELAAAARFHHERFNGAGYPDGVSGRAIPLLARLIAVCDSYEAMTAPERTYRQPLSDAQCQRIFASDRGVLFDPEIAGVFAEAAF